MIYIYISISLLGSIFLISKASNYFEKSADYLSRNLSEGVKGATINAIGSSMPEFITTFFFLIIMKDINGFIGGLGTSVGSAMFNILVIPSLVGIILFFKGKLKFININKKLFLRDGFFLIFFNIILLAILFLGDIKWFYTLPIILFYGVYIAFTLRKKKKSNKNNTLVEKSNKKEWIKLFISLIFLTIGCYLLVETCIELMKFTGLSIYFVSIIFAGGLTSIPDAILSIKDIKKGNYADSFTNVFGSNIFDIGIAFGIPVFIYTLFFNSINIEEHISYSNTLLLSIVSIVITIISFIVFIYKKIFNRIKVYILSALYILFIVFSFLYF